MAIKKIIIVKPENFWLTRPENWLLSEVFGSIAGRDRRC